MGTVRDVQMNQTLAVVLTDTKATLHPIECTCDTFSMYYTAEQRAVQCTVV